MSLPRKRKRLYENQVPVEENQSGRHTKKSSGNPSSGVSARTTQMQKAFEIVDHIEHTHDAPEVPETAAPRRPPVRGESPDPEGFRMKVSLGTDPGVPQTGNNGPGGPAEPFIEVRLTIPAFLWKVPVLGGVARSLVRRISKEQA